MNEVETRVTRHYGSDDLTHRILAALSAAGLDVDKLSAEALFPFDQMHGRQLAATKEHVGRLALDPAKHVLDVGSGVGGPARYMAFATGCRVTGIDLTEPFVAAARELTARCGLANLVDFQVGSALAIPFDDAVFDAVACQYVAMNIPDKAGLLHEMSRVVKPGGQLMFSAVVAGQGEPRYPLPWAREPSVSFLVAPESLQQLFDEAGWRIVEWTDETSLFHGSAAPPLSAAASHMRALISGDDFPERARNFAANLGAGAIRSVLVVAEKPQ